MGDKAMQPFLLANPRFAEYCDFNVLHMGCDDARFLDLSFLPDAASAAPTTIVL
jgi:hypothetical protein